VYAAKQNTDLMNSTAIIDIAVEYSGAQISIKANTITLGSIGFCPVQCVTDRDP
jgi:hypothetical protein